MERRLPRPGVEPPPPPMTVREVAIWNIEIRAAQVGIGTREQVDAWVLHEWGVSLGEMDDARLRHVREELERLARVASDPATLPPLATEYREPIRYDREGVTPEECVRDYPYLWATLHRDFGDLSAARRAQIVALMTGVCGACHDAEVGCQCWNDE